MSKDEMIMLITAFDAIIRLNEKMAIITGTEGLACSEYYDMCSVGAVIHMNCPFYEPDNDENLTRFFEIACNSAFTTEERYWLLMAEPRKDTVEFWRKVCRC